MGSAPRPGCFIPGNEAIPTAQQAGWAPGPVLTGIENLAPTGIRSPDRPARSELGLSESMFAQRTIL